MFMLKDMGTNLLGLSLFYCSLNETIKISTTAVMKYLYRLFYFMLKVSKCKQLSFFDNFSKRVLTKSQFGFIIIVHLTG